MRAWEPQLISFSSGPHLTWIVQSGTCMGFFPSVIVSVYILSLIGKTSVEVEFPWQLNNFSSLHGFSPIFMHLVVSLSFLFPIISHYLICRGIGPRTLSEGEAGPKVSICHLSTFPDLWDLLSRMVVFRWEYMTKTHLQEGKPGNANFVHIKETTNWFMQRKLRHFRYSVIIMTKSTDTKCNFH